MTRNEHTCVEDWLNFAYSEPHKDGREYHECTLKIDMAELPAGTYIDTVMVDHDDSTIYLMNGDVYCPMFPFKIVPGEQEDCDRKNDVMKEASRVLGRGMRVYEDFYDFIREALARSSLSCREPPQPPSNQQTPHEPVAGNHGNEQRPHEEGGS